VSRPRSRRNSSASSSDPSVTALPFTTGVIQPNDPYRKDKGFSEAPPDAAGDLVVFQDANGNGFYDPGTDTKAGAPPGPRGHALSLSRSGSRAV